MPSAEEICDVKGALLEPLCDVLGRSLPSVVMFELHDHLTRGMADEADAMPYRKEYPHIKVCDRGEEVGEPAATMVRDEVSPVMHLKTLSMVIPSSTTKDGPAHSINGRCVSWRAEQVIIDRRLPTASRTTAPVVAVMVLAIDDAVADRTRAAGYDIESCVWETRAAFLQDLSGTEEVVRLALAVKANAHRGRRAG